MENFGNDNPEILIRQVLNELSSLRSQIPNGEFKSMQRGLDELKRNQDEMKDSLSELKRRLLDPEDGIIVKVNRNTEFREEGEEKIAYWERKIQKIEEIDRWKSGVNKALWIILTAILSIVVKLIFFPDSNI